ncbi:hypothetical protein K491DRAFT_703033 [Lophiostoma macrostomum CBS 122681]|uniref:MARVEL domain-containing protein n=1 Tax=Lophiostoma macrostomum CBS 122681 TaxID=1314788 RepID=A0A6A6TGJ7_9PLEO|nr:hypothetical protein K491DRAFT_703033 [Lophiostoma macrostomum CBS 122681]
MAAHSYYAGAPLTADQQAQQHLLSPSLSSPGFPSPGLSSGQSSPLKPLHLVTKMEPYSPHFESMEHLKSAHEEDGYLKMQIRRLRFVSRILAFLISIAVFTPIAMTLHKFLTTKDVFHDVISPDGTIQSRTAWAKNSKEWPTYMYFAVAATSLLLNLVIVLAYMFSGVDSANRAAVAATVFTWIHMIGNLIVWAIAASLYRTEKDKGGKHNDLWGWTCSAPAKAIQKDFAHVVDFNAYCNIQSISWYIGLVQVAAALLTVIIYIMTYKRMKMKKSIKRRTQLISARGYPQASY